MREHPTGRRWILGLVLALAIVVPGCGPPVEPSASGGTFATTIAAPAQTGIVRFSDLPPVLVTELPLEALDTLDLIAAGGPFPFDRDGLTFQNREGLLPERAPGHYREFTVITPGEPTRGARRVVAGDDGELFYTDDHYRSFFEITPED